MNRMERLFVTVAIVAGAIIQGTVIAVFLTDNPSPQETCLSMGMGWIESESIAGQCFVPEGDI